MQLAASLALVLLSSGAVAQTVVVPARSASADGDGIGAIPGFTQRFRQQVIYGDGTLTLARGQTVREIRFRRDGQFARALTPGRALIDATMSMTTRSTVDVSAVFAVNHGTAMSVFSGFVSLPASPAITHRNDPTWDAPYAVGIPLTNAFAYTAGSLIVDLSGTPDTNNRSPWWPVDYHNEAVTGTVTSIGTACDPRNDLFVAREQLVPGASVRFVAGGQPLGNNVLAIAVQRIAPIDLGFLGFPGCTLHMIPDVMLLQGHATGWNGSPGTANHVVHLPAQTQLLGAGLSVQGLTAWVEQGSQLRLTTSPALDLALAGRLPTLDAAVVTSVLLTASDPWPASGRVSLTRVPVTRFGF
jgi:hypothetical protein